jgi:HD superfamily phosphohydrolase
LLEVNNEDAERKRLDAGKKLLDSAHSSLLQTYTDVYKLALSLYVKGEGSKKLRSIVNDLKLSYNERKQEQERLSKQFEVFSNDPKLKELRKLSHFVFQLINR